MEMENRMEMEMEYIPEYIHNEESFLKLKTIFLFDKFFFSQMQRIFSVTTAPIHFLHTAIRI